MIEMKSMLKHFEEINNPNKNVYSIHPPLPEKMQLELNETCNYKDEYDCL